VEGVLAQEKVEGCGNLLNLKMRTDTPQTYEHILVENVNGWIKGSFLMCAPWTQFADLEGRPRAEVASCAARQARAAFQGRLFRRCRGGRPVISQGGIP